MDNDKFSDNLGSINVEDVANLTKILENCSSVTEGNKRLQEKLHTVQDRYDSKCLDLENAQKLFVEQKGKLYDYLIWRVKKSKQFWLETNKVIADKDKKILDLQKCVESNKCSLEELQGQLGKSQDDCKVLEEVLNQRREKMKEKDKIIEKIRKNLQLAQDELRQKKEKEDKMVQTDSSFKPNFAEAATSTEVTSKDLWCQEAPLSEWVLIEGVPKIVMTFPSTRVVNANEVSLPRLQMENTNRKRSICDDNRLNGTEPDNTPLPKKMLKYSLCSTPRLEVSQENNDPSSASEHIPINNHSHYSEQSKFFLRKKLVQHLEQTRCFEAEPFNLSQTRTLKSWIFQCMFDLVKRKEEKVVIDKILDHLLSRQTEYSLSLEHHWRLSIVEQLISTCLCRFEKNEQSNLVNLYRERVYAVIKDRKCRHSVTGLASMCLVFAHNCKRLMESEYLKSFCFLILMWRKEVAGFLLACICCVEPNAFEFTDNIRRRAWLERVVWHILSKKPAGISVQKWEEVLGVLANNPEYVDKSNETPECLFEDMMNDLKKNWKLSLEHLEDDFVLAVKLLGAYKGKEWTEEVIVRQIKQWKRASKKPKTLKHVFLMLENLEAELKTHFDAGSNSD